MSNELVIHHPTGATLYVLLFDATGQIWNGSAFAAPGSAAWTDYDIAMSEVATATGIYRASMPAAAAGTYGWVVRKQAGGSPAVGDIAVGSGEIRWTGTAEETIPASANVTLWRGAQPLELDDGYRPLVYAVGGSITASNSVLTSLGDMIERVGPPDEEWWHYKATALEEAVLTAQEIADAQKLAPDFGPDEEAEVGSINWALGEIRDDTSVQLPAAIAGISTSGLTAQQTADAVNNLAPASTGATGSIRAKLDAIELATDAIDTSAVLDEVIEGTHTMRQLLRLFSSMLLSKASGGGTDTLVFRDIDNSKNRVTITVDAHGNRSTIVLDED